MRKALFITGAYPSQKHRNNYTFSHELVIALSQVGVRISVISLKAGKGTIWKKDEYNGIPVYRCHFDWKLKNFLNIYRNIKSISKGTNNVIFSFLYVFYLPFLHLFNKKNKLQIVHGGDVLLHWQRPVKRFLKKIVLKRMDYYFPVSDATQIYLEHSVPKRKIDKIHVIYNGINRLKFRGCRTKDEIRKSMGLSDSLFTILTVCNLIERKGVDILLEADKLLMDKGIYFIHYIVGRGPEESRLKSLVSKYDLESHIVFIPYIESDFELAELFIASDLYAMMSKTDHETMAMEGFGIVYAEAQFCGVPVIAGKSGGVPSSVRDSFTGYLIDPEKADAAEDVCSSVSRLADKGDEYKALARNARLFATENFDWDKYALQLLKYFV